MIEGRAVLTIPIEKVDRIRWDKEEGQALESAREQKGFSRQQIADGIKSVIGEDCSQQLIYKIERAVAGWASVRLLLAYCKVAGLNAAEYLPIYINPVLINVEKTSTETLTVSTSCVNI